jgi:opacity protein-like surface antigen
LLRTIAVVAAAVGPATPGSAQTAVASPTHWTLTPFVGVAFSGDLDSGTGSLGAAGGYMWNDRVALEAEFNFLPSSEASGLVELDSREWSLTGNLLYHFAGRSAFVPYGVVGMGFGHGSVDVDDADPALVDLDSDSTEFVATLGGGVERAIRDRLAFRGDLRYFFGGDFVPDFWRLSAGLTFDLGGR